jgi:hypothetical protein
LDIINSTAQNFQLLRIEECKKMENIRDVLLTQKRELERYGKKQYIERNIELTALNTDIIKVITGLWQK